MSPGYIHRFTASSDHTQSVPELLLSMSPTSYSLLAWKLIEGRTTPFFDISQVPSEGAGGAQIMLIFPHALKLLNSKATMTFDTSLPRNLNSFLQFKCLHA